MNVLVTGAGIGGPVVAYWLAKQGINVTIVERSPEPRTTGQAIDVRGPAVKIIQKMGLEEAVRSCHTQEKGIEKIGANGTPIARFDASGDASNQSLISEFEILRADLARIFVDAVKDTVKIHYGDYIKSLTQQDDRVHVSFLNGLEDATYDFVVAADGMSSRTRALVTGRPARDDLKQVGGYAAYFTIPQAPNDSRDYARFYNAVGSRSILLRPNKAGMGAYLFKVVHDERCEEALGQGPDAQRSLLAELFKDVGWEAPRVIEGMKLADDFYFQEMSQVHADRWVYDRVALLGDAAYAPSGLTGMGTSSAIYGAYILAGEVQKHGKDVSEGLKSYEKSLRPYITKIQKIPPGAPGIFNPATETGITILNGIAATISFLGLQKLGQYIPSTRGEDQQLPDYDWGAISS